MHFRIINFEVFSMNQMIPEPGDVTPVLQTQGLNYVDKLAHCLSQIRHLQKQADSYKELVKINCPPGTEAIMGNKFQAMVQRYVEERVNWEKIARDSEPSSQKISGNTRVHNRERVVVQALEVADEKQ